MNIVEQITEAAEFVGRRLVHKPEIGIILGSGLGALGDRVQEPVRIAYQDIPHFTPATVEGHDGCLVSGLLQGRPVMVFQGRLHYYEGLSMDRVVFPVRLLRILGAGGLVVTNAAGGIDPGFRPGDLMLIRDHIKMVTDSPLRGPNIDRFGPRFNDMSDPYSSEIREIARSCGKQLGIDLKEGVYCFMPGPSYETASEIRMLGLLGGHAVGMSTVPEVIAAAHCSMKVLGISCIANMGTGLLPEPLNHDDIIRVGMEGRARFVELLESVIQSWPGSPDEGSSA